MKNWLDKYEYGGQAGYTDVPFNYNSAWGGQFAMGGSLPGTVGFTYARTKGIPSNGPYAKKTKASAQNGNVTSSDDDKVDYKELQAKNMEESVNFLKDWYTKRATLPQFKDVSERRLKVLEKPIEIEYLDPQIMNAQGFAGAYSPRRKNLTLPDPNPSFADFPEYEKYMQYSTGSPLFTHEFLHRLHYEAPQFTDVVPEKITEKVPGYPELTDPEYISLGTGKIKTGFGKASKFYPEMEAITGMLRQAETIDPIKPVTLEEVSSYIKKYDKYDREIHMKDVDVDQSKEFHRGRLIKQLFDVMGNDPKRIAAYLNSVAKNDNNNNTQLTAQKGEIIKQDSTDYQTLPEVSISPMVDPEVEQARQSMFDFYSNRPANLSGGVASEAVQNVKIKEIPTKRLQKLNAYGLYFPKTNTIGYSNETITPEGYSENPYDELKTIQHEIGHSVFESLPENEQEIIRESIISPKEFRQRWPKGEISRSWSKYVTKPTEFYTRRNKMFDIFEIDGSQPITEDKAQEMIDFRRFMSSTASPEEKEELLKKHPNLNKYKENYENSPVKGEIIDFMNSIKNDVPTYKRVFNEVTAVPGEQAPIAQNGMTYYQHGLDWKPKTISRDGSDIPKNQNAQYKVPSFTMPRATSESTATRFFDPVTKRMVSTATTGQKKEDVAASTKDMGKARKFEKEEEKKRVAERKSAVAAKDKGQPFTLPSGETKKYEDMDTREKMYVSGKALEQRGRMYEDEESFLDEYINPLNLIGTMAGGLGTAPYEARESDSNLPYLTAIGAPLMVGAMGFDPLGSAIKFAKNPITQNVVRTLVDIPRAESIKEAIGRVGGIPLKKDIPRMAAQDVKALRQVQEIGRLRATGSRSADQMKYALENNLPEEHFQKVFNRSKEEAQNLLDTGFGEQEAQSSIDLRRRLTERMNRPRTRGRSQSPREMVIENLRTHDDILHGADSEVRNIVGDVNISREDGLVNYDALSDEQLARLRDYAESRTTLTPEEEVVTDEIIQSYTPGDTDIDVAREPFNIDWNTATDSDVAEAARRWGVSEDIVRSIGERHAIRSNRVQEFIERINPDPIIRSFEDEDILNIVRTNTPGQKISRLQTFPYRINDKLENFLINKTQNYPYYSGEVLEKVPSLHLSSQGGLKNVSKKVNFSPEGIQSGDVFTGSTNTSHSSYLPQLKQVFKYTKGDPQFLGYKPMNSLGFLSQYNYSGGDIAKYLNSEIDEQIKRGILPKDVSRPFVKGESVMLPHYGVKQRKKGGVIKDDMGQWAHPGEITEIGSNQITMQGVPYPVLGISDTGDTQMMYPEQEYKFKGKKVTEYPMAQTGYVQPPTRSDSLFLLNNNKIIEDLLKTGKYKWSRKIKTDSEDWKNQFKAAKEFWDTGIEKELLLKNPGIKSKGKLSDYKKQKGKFIGTSDWLSGGGDDYGYPIQYITSNIVPQFQGDLVSTSGYKENPFIYSYGYEPLAITPWDMLNEKQQQQRLKIYGTSGTPYTEQPQTPKREEPKLKRKVSKMEPISTKSSYTPSLRTIQHPNIELPGIQMGDYDVSYYSPESKDWANRRFTSQEESDRFAQEMSQRGYPGSYGNVTQTKKTNKKSTGGWLDKYN